ncbi:MAG TPA: group II truncated hemoglobin [Caulobacteraceae bacterium]|jgi:truncated hemoglobin YjbI
MQTDPPTEAAEPTLFEWAGGYPALLAMTTILYRRYVPQDPLIGPLFAGMSADHPERVASWLAEVFGGPKLYSERYGGYRAMIAHHAGKNIKPEQRQRWASLMAQSADDAGLPTDPEFRAAFVAYIEWGSRLAVENSGPGAAPPPNMPVPRWWWVCDATPGSRLSALATERPAASAWSPPEPEAPLDFDRHIKPLFRPMDRNSMRFAFDLWSQADLIQHGQAILGRLKSGAMPCDGAWPPAKIALFETWLKGKPAAS